MCATSALITRNDWSYLSLIVRFTYNVSLTLPLRDVKRLRLANNIERNV